jgi:thymidylate synthase (FAD)
MSVLEMVNQQISVLNHGFVRLDDCMADDLSVVGKRHEEIEEGDPFLLKFLMKNRHGTPFEHNAFRFHIKAPIFVFREWQRHRIASYNEMSARYMELPGEWYIPKLEHVRVRVGKPGHYTYEPARLETAVDFIETLTDVCDASYMCYKDALKFGIAPELARCFLHVNHYSEMYWTTNARSMMNFLSLRNHPEAQWEIQQFAGAVEMFFRDQMPITANAFVDLGRIAP